MDQLTASYEEACENFSELAARAHSTGQPVTVPKDMRPWVEIVPIAAPRGDRIPVIDWPSLEVVKMDPETRGTILPASWDDPEDEDLYSES